MDIAGRTFLVFAALLIWAYGTAVGQEAQPKPGDAQLLVYVGTYTDKTSSKGVYSFRYDSTKGKLTELGLAAEAANPSLLAVHPNRQFFMP